MKNTLKEFLPIIVSAVLLAQGFTIKWFSLFAFVALIPFIYQLYKSSFKNVWKYSLAFSLSFWLSLVYWLYIFHPLALPLVLLLLSFYFLLFSFTAKWLILKFPNLKFIIIPILWTVMEYLTSLGFLGFPWGSMAVTQHRFLSFIQIADVFGIWGVSFAVILFNSLLLEIYILYKQNRYQRIKIYISFMVVVFGLILIYGGIQIHKPLQVSPLKIALIQGNINPNYKWRRIKYHALSRIKSLSQSAIKKNNSKLDLIVLWETAVMDYLKFNLAYEKIGTNPRFKESVFFDKKVVALSTNYKTPILIGIPDVKHIQKGYEFHNSAVLINTNGKIVSQYNKMHLVPFGEWFPFENIFPFVRKMLDAVSAGDYTPGKDYTIFKVKDKSFGVLVCYEGIFGYLARNFILKDADFFINITDDMWSFNPQAELQHRNLDIFRAVENRVPFIRSGNSGATCLISPTGKIESQLPLFTPNYLIVSPSFEVTKNKTIYAQYGDWFPKFLFIITLLLLILAIIKIKYSEKRN